MHDRECTSKSVWVENIYRACFLKRTDQVLIMIYDTRCGGGRKDVKLAHWTEFTCISMAAAFRVMRHAFVNSDKNWSQKNIHVPELLITEPAENRHKMFESF